MSSSQDDSVEKPRILFTLKELYLFEIDFQVVLNNIDYNKTDRLAQELESWAGDRVLGVNHPTQLICSVCSRNIPPYKVHYSLRHSPKDHLCRKSCVIRADVAQQLKIKTGTMT